MTLENLLAIHKLQRFEASPEGVRRLLVAAERNIAATGTAKCRQARQTEGGNNDVPHRFLTR